MKRTILLALAICGLAITACSDLDKTREDVNRTKNAGNKLAGNQPTPTDIEYSLERYNLIRRAYWVNGLKEKARTVSRPAEVPMGYCVLLSYGNVVGQFNVDGKVTSLNSYLTGNYYYEYSYTKEMPDIDGCYGENDDGVFFFTPDWKYIEWNGEYIYSDTPFKVSDTILEDF